MPSLERGCRRWLYLSLVLAACSGSSSSSNSNNTPSALPRATAALFINGNFESDLTGWTETFYLNSSGLAPASCSGTGASMTCAPTDKSQLRLTTAGAADDPPPAPSRTRIISGAEGTVSAEGLGAGELLLPKWGSGSVVVNDMGYNQKAAGIDQTMTVTNADVDPGDGKVHVRFALAPVLENPGHTANQQPFFYAQLSKVDANGVQIGNALFYTFNYSNQAGVPWKTSSTGALYTDWQAFDIAPGNATLAVGDRVKLEVIASGCQPGGHHGHVYVDGLGAFLPGLSVAASAPASVNTGAQFSYALSYRNGGSDAAANVRIEQTIPTGATFASASGPGGACTSAVVNGKTVVTCPVGTLNPGGAGTVYVTVNVTASSGSTISNGNYRVLADNTAPLLGPLALTSVTNAVSYADLSVSATGAPSVTWGQAMPATSFLVANAGPTAVTGASFTFTPPAELQNVSWSCAATGGTGGTCAASGTGPIADSVDLPVGASVTYTVTGAVQAGSGPGTLRQVATVAPLSGVTDDVPSNNTAVQSATIGDALSTLTVANTGGGTVVSVPAGIACGGSCAVQYATGSQVVLTASADTGKVFTGWTGGGCGLAPTCAVTLAGDTTVTASFAVGYYVSVSRTGAGSGVIACRSPVASGTSSTCTVAPAVGSYLQHLTDNGVDVTSAVASGAYVISNVTAAHAVVATFATSSDTISFTFSPASPAYGQPVTFTATVSFSGSPSGLVSFTDENGNVLCTASPVSGQASCATTSPLAPGAHVVTASYSGDATNNPCVSTSLTVPVTKIGTTTALPSSIPFGQPLTATVTPATTAAGVPDGTVALSEGATVLCTATLVAGPASSTATCSPSTPLAVGPHTITASYGGTSSFGPSAASGASVSVALADTVITVPTTLVYGQPLTALVAPAGGGAGTPTGTVTFSEGGVVLCTATLANGRGSCAPASPLAPGNHTIDVGYGGDSNFNASSAPIASTVSIAQLDTTTTLAVSPSPAKAGQAVTVTVTVASTTTGAGTPTGSVELFDGASDLGPVTLSNGTGIFTSSALAVGSHAFTARYSGDGTFNGSSTSGNASAVTVAMVDTTTTLMVSPSPAKAGQTVTVTVTVASTTPGAGTPTGSVELFDGASDLGPVALSDGTGTFTSSTLAVGSHALTARYSGDGTFNGSSTSGNASAEVTAADAGASTGAVSCQRNADCGGGDVCMQGTCVAPHILDARSGVGGGCSSGSGGTTLSLVGFCLFALRRRRQGADRAGSVPSAGKIALAVALVASATSASAQVPKGFALQTYEPAPAGDRFFVLPEPTVDAQRAPAVSLLSSWAIDPLVLRQDGQILPGFRVVHRQEWLVAQGSVPVAGVALIDLAMPFAVYQSGSKPLSDLAQVSTAALGDLRIGARAPIPIGGPLKLAAAVDLWLPTGSRDAFSSDGKVRALPKVIAGAEQGSWIFGAELGFLVRRSEDLGYTSLGNALAFSCGAAWRWRELRIGPEIYGRYQFHGEAATPVEGLLGGRWQHGPIELGLALGTGFDRSPGAAPFRAVVQLGWQPGRRAVDASSGSPQQN